MQTHKLTKNITLYKNQFDDFTLDIFQSHKLDRLSLELDGLMFRIKYMTRNKKDLDKIPELKEKFVRLSLEMRESFGKFVYEYLTQIVGAREEFIKDIMILDVKIDMTYVHFTMALISDDELFLQRIDENIPDGGPDGKPDNIFPNKYFRFYTDSYNDGIAKAYPELFENRQQDKIGSGKDSDVFVHSFTFQTSERCSLNCFAAGTEIVMADGSVKKIEDVVVGDYVLGIPEELNFDEYDDHPYHDPANYIPSRVTRTYHRQAETVQATYTHGGSDDPMFRVTREHPFLTCDGEFKAIEDIKRDGDAFIWRYPEGIFSQMDHYEFTLEPYGVEDVYNLETETHTYIAEQAVVHNCTYCYQFNKSPMRMKFETAKTFIDNLLDDKYGYINRYNSPAIIIEFIGGEPLLEINLTRRIYEYFLERCYELNHPWFTLHRLSICSNGLQYFDKEVQDFFKEYAHNISFNISIDGNKELHDSCRIQPNGEGSYDIDMMVLNHYNRNYAPERNSKMTLAPNNIKYLFDSVVDFINHGMTSINLNCVFEEGWNIETARTEYEQLIKLADYILDHNLEHIYIAIFNERQEQRQDKSSDGNWCGGTGSMLALRPNGQFYPCIRYMPTSVGDDVKDLCIGTVEDGLIGRDEDSEILKMLDGITRRSQCNDICYDCPIGSDCPGCSALGHTVFGTPNKKCTFICIQMIAEALANVYYWNRLLIEHPEYELGVRKINVPDEWARYILSEKELNNLKWIEVSAMMKKIEYSKL